MPLGYQGQGPPGQRSCSIPCLRALEQPWSATRPSSNKTPTLVFLALSHDYVAELALIWQLRTASDGHNGPQRAVPVSLAVQGAGKAREAIYDLPNGLLKPFGAAAQHGRLAASKVRS
jgi:hypothetical protein